MGLGMESATEFRAEAAKCRALASHARDSMTARNLLALAEDYEHQAQQLESAAELQPPLRPAD